MEAWASYQDKDGLSRGTKISIEKVSWSKVIHKTDHISQMARKYLGVEKKIFSDQWRYVRQIIRDIEYDW